MRYQCVRDRGERGVRQHRRSGIVLVSYWVLPCAPWAGDGTGANAVLKSRMQELGLTQDELVGRTYGYVRCGPRRRRDERTSRNRRPSGRACEVGEGSHQGHDSVLELQQRNVGERLLRALYALAAEYSTSAAWSCIDARNLDQTQRHLNESATYVGLSQDGPTETRVTGQPLGSTSRRSPTSVGTGRKCSRRRRPRKPPGPLVVALSSTRRGTSVPPSPSRLSMPLGIDFRISGDRPLKRTR